MSILSLACFRTLASDIDTDINTDRKNGGSATGFSENIVLSESI